jgi:hypothetical protein
MPKICKKFIYLFFFFLFSSTNILCSQREAPAISVAALTWNVGNKTAQDNIVQGFADEIKKLGFPDALVVGTQEELAKNGEELKDKLALKLPEYHLVAQNAYTTLAGANNSTKTLGYAAVQNTVLPKAFGLPQNRCTLAILVKEGIALTGITKRIDYPPGAKKSNNAFIVIEGTITKNNHSLPISIASVHLNSKSDSIRRSHANYFFDNQKFTNVSKDYKAILEEAKRFHLVMGDFNERDYLMKDNTVADRGRLTNFTGYGYDFAEKQEREGAVSVYGTYGYTQFHNTTPEVSKDSRGRKHNAKGGFLDRIAVTSGLSIESAGAQYGALTTDKKEFIQKNNKSFYAGSDHLPIIRYFKVISSDDQKIVKDYVLRQLPNFEQEIKDIEYLIGDKQPGGIKARAKKLMFYDDPETPDKFLEKFSVTDHPKSGLVDNLTEKENALKKLQAELEELKNKVQRGSEEFLSAVYNKITECNKSRNLSLERMDDEKAAPLWYFPNSLSWDNFQQYEEVVQGLLKGPLTETGAMPITQKPSEIAPEKKKNFFRKYAEKIDKLRKSFQKEVMRPGY